jgi:hypothetical protein
MKLERYKEDSYEFSKLTSNIVRQFAFAGIAIIWIFKYDKPVEHLIPQELLYPLLYFVATLSFELFQYLIPTIIWSIFFHYNEWKFKGDTDKDIKASDWFSIPGWLFFTLKNISVIIGYYLLIKYLVCKI